MQLHVVQVCQFFSCESGALPGFTPKSANFSIEKSLSDRFENAFRRPLVSFLNTSVFEVCSAMEFASVTLIL